MIVAADFDQVYNTKPQNYEKMPCKPPTCFVASYPPVAKVGDPNGKFLLILLYSSPIDWRKPVDQLL